MSAPGEASSTILRFLCFAGAGVICTKAINTYRDIHEREKEASAAAQAAASGAAEPAPTSVVAAAAAAATKP